MKKKKNFNFLLLLFIFISCGFKVSKFKSKLKILNIKRINLKVIKD